MRTNVLNCPTSLSVSDVPTVLRFLPAEPDGPTESSDMMVPHAALVHSPNRGAGGAECGQKERVPAKPAGGGASVFESVSRSTVKQPGMDPS